MSLPASNIQFNFLGGWRLLRWSAFSLLATSSVIADTQTGTLGAQIGATDLYQLNCNSQGTDETSYASLRLMDTTNDAPISQPPQLINVSLSKLGLDPISNSIAEGNSSQFTLAGGNGEYQLQIDTTNSNPNYPKLNYQVFFQCYNANNAVTAGSAGGLKPGKFVNKTIATYKNKKLQLPASKLYKINCKANKKVTPIDSSYLVITVNNTSLNLDAAQTYLNAQLTRLSPGAKTLNASDRPGDQDFGSTVELKPVSFGTPVGNGSYYISVDTTANNQTTLKEKSYTLEYGCFSAAGTATSTNLSAPIQDQ